MSLILTSLVNCTVLIKVVTCCSDVVGAVKVKVEEGMEVVNVVFVECFRNNNLLRFICVEKGRVNL